MRIIMNQKGMAEARGKLGKIKGKLDNLRAPLKIGANRIDALMQGCFRSETDPSGKPWKQLKQATKENRARSSVAAKKRNKKGELTAGAKKIRKKILASGGIKILTDTGRLKNSMFAEPNHRGIRFGSNVDYLGPHQIGTDDIPRRMVAPVERRGRNWALIRRGPAQKVFLNLEKDLGRHVTV